MPFCLRDRDFTDQLDGVRSVLIVPCRFCPAASLAVRKNQAYMEPFKNLMRTAAYEDYLKDLVNSFELRGIRAEVVDCKLPNHFRLITGKRTFELKEVDTPAFLNLAKENRKESGHVHESIVSRVWNQGLPARTHRVSRG